MLVDDQALFRDALRSLLSLQPDFEVVAEAADGLAAVEVVRHHRPDVVLLDLHMPVLGGVAAAERMRDLRVGSRIIVLTTFDEDEEVFAAVRAGAAGYLLKASPSAHLFEAIRAAARGEALLSPAIALKLMNEFSRLADTRPVSALPAAALLEPLSARESQVLRSLSEGLSNKEIGAKLGIAEGTVKNHMSQVLAKLGTADRTQAALRARELGL